MAVLIGIDVGGTNLRLGVVDYDETATNAHPRLIEEKRFQTDFSNFCKIHPPEQAWRAILNATAVAIDSMHVKYPEISAVGIGFPGFINPHTQKISQSPNLPGLIDVDLSTDLSQLIELPVMTENDALAAAYGEYVMRMAQIDHLIYLGLGTGVGGGLILNGQSFQGQHGVAMEVGHITVQPNGRLCGCGNHGCMEQYASASGVAISYFEATGQQFSAHKIANLAHQGDTHAIAAYFLAGKTLAQALAHILKVLDVTNIVIGGGMSAAWLLIEPAFTQRLNEDLIPVLRGKVNVSISSMRDQAGIIGAAMLVQKKIVI
ncbi:MAG: ROK family protein [Methylotenera sp.]|uniref:ROK family protein n=1 Tax=Methylotenera sp. TaxID=2051956 RepID=UPI002489F888|nr:ROK family protein [Methylotenera sp.]MDI1309537.1 ROK family protein [Methylotenera sp.]